MSSRGQKKKREHVAEELIVSKDVNNGRKLIFANSVYIKERNKKKEEAKKSKFPAEIKRHWR